MIVAWKTFERRVAVALGGRRAGPVGAAVSDILKEFAEFLELARDAGRIA